MIKESNIMKKPFYEKENINKNEVPLKILTKNSFKKLLNEEITSKEIQVFIFFNFRNHK